MCVAVCTVSSWGGHISSKPDTCLEFLQRFVTITTVYISCLRLGDQDFMIMQVVNWRLLIKERWSSFCAISKFSLFSQPIWMEMVCIWNAEHFRSYNDAENSSIQIMTVKFKCTYPGSGLYTKGGDWHYRRTRFSYLPTKLVKIFSVHNGFWLFPKYS